MKFITRALYDAMQCEPETPESAAADAQWDARCAAYRAHLETIRSRLPASVQAFCDVSLHDGVITRAAFLPPDAARLEIDATNNPWGPAGCFRLTFTGVREVSPLAEIAGQWWLYEEVHLHPDAGFDYRMLLTEGEFRIVADEVELTRAVDSDFSTV